MGAKSRKPIIKSNIARSVKTNQIPDVFVDVYFLANHFSVTDKTIQNWARKWKSEGMPESGKRGQYNFIDFLTWRIQELSRELQAKEKGDEKESEARRRLMIVKADTAEHEYALRRGEYISIKDAKYVIANASALANVEFDNVIDPIVKCHREIDTEENFRDTVKELINAAKFKAAKLSEQADELARGYSKDLDGIQSART